MVAPTAVQPSHWPAYPGARGRQHCLSTIRVSRFGARCQADGRWQRLMSGKDGLGYRAVTRRHVLTALGALGAAGLTGVAACSNDKSTWNGPGGAKAKVSITEPPDGAAN